MVRRNHITVTPIGTVLRAAREKKRFTQLEVAEWVGISEKTLRNYENGEFTPTDVKVLQGLAMKLEIEPEQLGLARHASYTYEEADMLLEKGWSNLVAGDFTSAYHIGDTLTRSLTRQGGQALLNPLARAHFLVGHASTIIKGSQEVNQAFDHMKSMGDIAHLLADETLLTIALTYQGEMLRRMGRINDAIRTIEASPHNPLVDIMARGNRSQLLARAYASKGDVQNFKGQLLRAEELALQIGSMVSKIYIPYNLGSVYEEYARFYAQRGNIKESKRYIDLTERNIPQAPRWIMLAKLTKGEVLIRATARIEQRYPENLKHVTDFQDGLMLIGEATKLARKYGHQRLLRRAFMLKTTFTNEAVKFHIIVSMLTDVIERNTIDEQGVSDEY